MKFDNAQLKQHFIFFTANLPSIFVSGVETSMFKRSKLFIEQLGIHPIWISSEYNLNIPLVLEKLKQSGRIPQSLECVNLYDFFQSSGLNQHAHHTFKKQGVLTAEDKLNIKYDRLTTYDGDVKLHTKAISPDTGLITYIHYFDEEGRSIRLDNYSVDGYLSRKILYDYVPNKRKVAEYLYRKDGSICVHRTFSYTDGKESLSRIFVHDTGGLPIKTFFHEDELKQYLLEYYLSGFTEQDQVNIMIDKNFRLVHPVKDKADALIKMITILHSSHLKEPKDLDSDFRQHCFNEEVIDTIDAMVVLTEQQNADIVYRLGDKISLYTIPHSIEYHPKKVSFSQRNPYKVVAVGRFHPEKNYSKMIRMFSWVLKQVPQATLDIYGQGDFESELQRLIEEFELADSVKLCPFSENIYEVFSNASVSLVTSKYEGFSLVVLESLVSGCPVVSDNLRYGPASMIENGVNGYLIDPNDGKDFIKKVVSILSDRALNEQLSDNAYRNIDNFTEEQVAKLWQTLLLDLAE